MPPFKSRYLSSLGQRGLNKLGDVYCPGDQDFPSFSELGCIEFVDDALEHLPPGDRADLGKLLTVLAITPRPLVAGMIRQLERRQQLGGPVGSLVRFMRMGLKGMILTLYYSGRRGANFSGRTPLEVLGYEVGVYTADLPG